MSKTRKVYAEIAIAPTGYTIHTSSLAPKIKKNGGGYFTYDYKELDVVLPREIGVAQFYDWYIQGHDKRQPQQSVPLHEWLCEHGSEFEEGMILARVYRGELGEQPYSDITFIHSWWTWNGDDWVQHKVPEFRV